MARQRRTPSAQGLLGSLEYAVMRDLWHRFPASVGDVLQRINTHRDDDPLAYTTVMTVLSRLYDKGLVDREKLGRGYSYRPRFTEAELVEQLGREEVERVLDRFGGVALAHFASALSEADPAQLERLAALAQQDARAAEKQGRRRA